MRNRAENRDWAREVPDHYRRRGPYEDYGWESGQSVLEEWRDPSVHRMPYEMGQPYTSERRSYGRPYGAPGRMRGPYSERMPESYSGRGRYGDYEFGQPEGAYVEPSPMYTESRWVQGPHAGRGPRSYQPSDERISEDVCERLTRHGQIDPTDVEVSVDNGEVTLEGTVDSRRTKRMVEDVAETVQGVRDVHNRLQIRERAQQQAGRGRS